MTADFSFSIHVMKIQMVYSLVLGTECNITSVMVRLIYFS